MGSLQSEGAAFGSDQSQPVFSPYSPYSPVSDKSLSLKVDNTAANKKFVAESTKRLANNYGSYIEKKSWMDIQAENTRYLYSLRRAMNALAKTDAAKAAAKKVFVDLEALTYASKIKDQAGAYAAIAATNADLAAFSKLV